MKDAKKHWRAAKDYGISPMPTPEEVAQRIWSNILEAKSWVGMSKNDLLEALHDEWFKEYRIARQEGFNEGVEMCKHCIENVRREGYNDIDYALQKINSSRERQQ